MDDRESKNGTLFEDISSKYVKVDDDSKFLTRKVTVTQEFVCVQQRRSPQIAAKLVLRV
jgi:hypothetical protein